MKISPNVVTPIMPENTAVPSVWRGSAPAPTAQTSGTTPKMKASEVIRIGRSRSRAASTATAQREQQYRHRGDFTFQWHDTQDWVRKDFHVAMDGGNREEPSQHSACTDSFARIEGAQ